MKTNVAGVRTDRKLYGDNLICHPCIVAEMQFATPAPPQSKIQASIVF